MPQLLLISEKSLSTKDNREAGDIVGVFPDSHVFSAHEQDIFDIVQITETTKVAVEVTQPEVREATRATTVDWTLEEPERKEVWKDSDGSYKEVAVKPRLALRYDRGAILENYSRHPENLAITLIAAPAVVRE